MGAFTPFDPTNGRFAVIFDSGASCAISGFREDFVLELTSPSTTMKLGGMANGMNIVGAISSFDMSACENN